MSFRIDPRLPLTGEVRRILADEIGRAISHLETAREKPEQGLHKCRKRLKSVRALLRMVRSGDEPFCRTENECYKQVSALLAGPREATALIETVDRLADAFPEQSAGGGLDPVRERLVLPDLPEQAADILADGARATLRRAKKALDKAEARGEDEDFHNLRKAAKTHSMHLSLLGRLWPTPIKARREAVDKLGEQLGELHDVFVMRALL
ncbi:MAG: CHAD domain-containing protein, partial [Mesorhizobium sp.]